jgi:hypothetical protein
LRNSEDADVPHLLCAIAVSAAAREHGNHPFGAILVSAEGDVLLEAENTVVTDDDVTGHAETNLVRAAARELVYGLSGKAFIELAGPGGPALDHPSRAVLAGGNREVVVTGPLLEDEAAVPHRGFWAP